MILGNGDIAKILTDHTDRIYFASGVSNSQCTDVLEFERERQLLMKQPELSHLIYFSTLSIYYADTPYTKHKRNMEVLVKDRFSVYTIVRLGNITWGENPHTIINSLRAKIKNGEPYQVKDEYRYLVDRGEFTHWIGMIPDFSTEMNITGSMKKIDKIVYDLIRETK